MLLRQVTSCVLDADAIDDEDAGTRDNLEFRYVVEVKNNEAWLRSVITWTENEDGEEVFLCSDAYADVLDPADPAEPSGPCSDSFFEASAPDLETALRWLITGDKRGLSVTKSKRRPKLGQESYLTACGKCFMCLYQGGWSCLDPRGLSSRAQC